MRTNYNCLIEDNISDPKVKELYYVLDTCLKMNERNEIIYIFLEYINNKYTVNYSELEQHPLISQLVNYLEGVNINTDHNMFMTYYRVLRSLKRA